MANFCANIVLLCIDSLTFCVIVSQLAAVSREYSYIRYDINVLPMHQFYLYNHLSFLWKCFLFVHAEDSDGGTAQNKNDFCTISTSSPVIDFLNVRLASAVQSNDAAA